MTDEGLQFMQDRTVPEAPDDNVTEPESEWKAGTYAGYDCMYREVTDSQGEAHATKRGNRFARKGDFIVLGLDEAPAGYHSQTIARVVRKEDKQFSDTRKSQA